MASFSKYQTKKGEFWLFRISLTDPITFEKKKTTRRGFKKLSEAKLAASKLELADKRVHLNTQLNKTFYDVFKENEEEYSKYLKPSTIYRKSVDINKWIIPYFGSMALKDITKKKCQNFIDYMSKQLRSYKVVVIQAKSILDFAVQNNYIELTPFTNTVYPKTTLFEEIEPAEKFWDREQSLYFLNQLKLNETLKHQAIFRTLLLTGLRKGELFALTEDDLNIENKSLLINKTIFNSKENKYQLLKPKTKASERNIYLDNETLQLLTDLIRINKKLRLKFNIQLDHNFIFMKEKSFGPYRNSYLNEVLNRFCQKYQMPRITVHGLRHSCASLLFAAGVDIKVVQNLLGHAHTETTMNIYTHVTEKQIENTSNLLANYLEKEPDFSLGSHKGVTKLFKYKKRP